MSQLRIFLKLHYEKTIKMDEAKRVRNSPLSLGLSLLNGKPGDPEDPHQTV
jgi:hypothetical protein